MHTIDPERWRTLDPYLDQALDLAEPERREWLDLIERADSALAADLRFLLDHNAAAEREAFLEAGIEPVADALVGHASRAGEALGAYTLEAPLGRGGMGSVW